MTIICEFSSDRTAIVTDFFPAAEQKAAPTADEKSSDLIDINSAKVDLTEGIPGNLPCLGRQHHQRKEPPYKMRTLLKSKKIVPAAAHEKIAGMIIVKRK